MFVLFDFLALETAETHTHTHTHRVRVSSPFNQERRNTGPAREASHMLTSGVLTVPTVSRGRWRLD